MKFSRISLLVALAILALLMPGCGVFGKKKDKIKKLEPTIEDQNGDSGFQSFLGRLQQAAHRRDKVALASMMSGDFGYSWEEGGEGAGVFDYWDGMGLWPELDLILKERFAPSEDFMVAPPQAAYDPDYKGYRAGLRRIQGAWRFVYFVSAPPSSVR
jgi:hypothetical protein